MLIVKKKIVAYFSWLILEEVTVGFDLALVVLHIHPGVSGEIGITARTSSTDQSAGSVLSPGRRIP